MTRIYRVYRCRRLVRSLPGISIHPIAPMPIAFLTRTVRFSAAHRYHRPDWTEERNREVFGACANPHGHGHNYRLEATVAGEPDGTTGFSIDLGELDRVLRDEVVSVLDHRHLSYEIPEFAEGMAIPTTENLVIWIWNRVAPRIRDARLVRLRLHEDVDLYVDYYGPDPGEDARNRGPLMV